MNADGTGVVQLSDDGPSFDSVPVWSPDGSRIAFTSDRDGSYEIYCDERGWQRYVEWVTENDSVDQFSCVVPGRRLDRFQYQTVTVMMRST